MTGRFTGERAVVVGFGVSGRAAVTALLEEGAQVRVTESRSAADLGGVPGDVELLAGGHRPEHLEGATLVVTSPGIPQHEPVLTWAAQRGLPVWSELELGARLCTVPYVAVTGTNGKTTTVEIIAEMMRAAGLDALACGNVGYPFSRAARERHDALAVEASSFQLRLSDSVHPRVSLLLNLAPDHLDWHGSFGAYQRAKAKIFRRQSGTEGDVHVGNRDDAGAARVSREAPCAVHWFGMGEPEPGEPGAGVAGGRIVLRSAGGAMEDLEAPGGPGGRAFLSDCAAAAAAGSAFGLPLEALTEGLRDFRPLPHRGAVVAGVRSVRFLDDSKATNPHAALAALDGLSDVVLIAGGLAKGVDLTPLASAAPALVAVVAIGESAAELERVFEGRVPARRAGSMDEAVRAGFELAPANGTVLLAPACASFDMFRDYADRGDRFAAAARALAGGAADEVRPASETTPTRRSHA